MALPRLRTALDRLFHLSIVLRGRRKVEAPARLAVPSAWTRSNAPPPIPSATTAARTRKRR